jgi:hypothetical protein
MNMKTALIGSFAAAAALVAVSTDASARSWNYKRTACGPSATIIKHKSYGFVGSDRDYGVRSRTYVRGERANVRFGVRGGHDRIGVNVRERAGANVNVKARFGGQDRSGTRLSGSERNTGAGAGGATGRSVSPSNTSGAGSSGGAASSGAAAKTGAGGGAGLGASGGGSSSGGGGMSSGGGGGGSR